MFSTHDPWDGIESLCQFYGVEFDFGPNAGKECAGVDGCEHGTHVAGIAAGSNGVAPGVDILSIQVNSRVNNVQFCGGSNKTPCLTIVDSNLEAALEHIYIHYWVYDPVVVNLSLGRDIESTAACDTSSQVNSDITVIIDNLFNQGVSVVAASGNEGHTNGASWPACLSNVISVGAVNKQDQHWVESDTVGSNAASYLDLVAPGVDINSTVPGNGYSTLSGTSMAAPHVAGTIALLTEAYPFFNPTTIRSLLHNTADIVPEMSGWAPTNEHGWGRLNTYDAVLQALSLNPDYRIIDYSTTYSDLTIFGETIFVMPGVTLTIDGTLTLHESQLVVLGTLAGSSSSIIYLLNANQPEYRASGVNAFGGSIVNLITEYESQNFSSNSTIFVPPHTVTISGTTTIDDNITLYINSQVILSGTVNGGNGSRIIVSDALEIQAGTTLNNVQLVSDDDGFISAIGSLSNPIAIDGQNVDRPWSADALLLVNSGGGANVQNAVIKNSRHLITLLDASTATIKNNDLINFSNQAQSIGIYVNGNQGSVLIEGNTITGDNNQGNCVRVDNADSNVLIKDNSINHCNIGLRFLQSTSGAIGNIIEENAFGVNADFVSTAEYRDNKIRYNISRGLFLNSASPWLMGNVIAGNSGNQVLASQSSPNFADYPTIGNPEPGHNVIALGGGPMVRAQNGSYIFFGYYSQGGYNSFYDTDTPHIWSESSSGVWADLNYWDGGAANWADGTSFVTNLYPLSTDPNPPYFQKSLPLQSAKVTTIDFSDSLNHSPPKQLMKALKTGMGGDYEKALNQLDVFIRTDRESAYAPLALSGYYSLMQRNFHLNHEDMERADILEDLNSYLSLLMLGYEDQLTPYLYRILANEAVLNKQYSEAIDYYKELKVNAHTNSNHQLIAIYNLYIIHEEIIGDKDASSGYLEKLIELYPNEELTLSARASANLPPLKSESNSELLGNKIDEETLIKHTAYPNPFNPTTNIRFSIQTGSNVQVSIYDILGRRVAQLVNADLESGVHEFSFNGASFSSGIYIYRLSVDGNVNTGKIMMLK